MGDGALIKQLALSVNITINQSYFAAKSFLVSLPTALSSFLQQTPKVMMKWEKGYYKHLRWCRRLFRGHSVDNRNAPTHLFFPSCNILVFYKHASGEDSVASVFKILNDALKCLLPC